MLNMKIVSLRLCLYATFKAQFIKKLSNTEAELKKVLAYEEKRVSCLRPFFRSNGIQALPLN